MSNQNHPWIQDFASYEAVLRCTHEIGQWEESATLRAYQTYGFDDASTPGNDQTFRHIDTGVLLLHDGEVVAIQFGDGNLGAALSDLFLVLCALGWKEAEVYHPSETLGTLLRDMGKAIPGHMEFDVKAAKDISGAAHLPEAAALIEHGKSILQGIAATPQEAQDFNTIALGALESMAPDHAFDTGAVAHGATLQETHQAEDALAVSAPVHLDDELVFDDVGAASQPYFTSEPQGVRPHGQVFLDDDDSVPVVPKLGATAHAQSGTTEGYPVHDIPAETPEGATAEYPLASQVEERGHVVPQDEPEVEPVREALPVAVRVDAPVQGRAERSMAQIAPGPDVASPRLICVGASALCFDRPDSTLSLDDIGDCAAQMEAVEVVHLWPGLVNQSERWDLIGEIDHNAPWFAETLANELATHGAIERVWFAAALLELARQREDAQLRDLVVKLLAEDASAACGAVATPPLFKPDAHERFANAVLNRFLGLLLSQEGQSFLDVRPPAGAENVTQNIRTFSVRSLLLAPERKLYVVHLDAADGPFVEMIVDLLMSVAIRYSGSTRGHKQAQALKHEADRRESTQREAEQKAVLESATQTMVSLMEQLKKAGLVGAFNAAGFALPN